MPVPSRRGPVAVFAAAALTLPLLSGGALASSAPAPEAPDVPKAVSDATVPLGTGVLSSMSAAGDGLIRLQTGAFDPTTAAGPVQEGLTRLEESALAPDTAYPWLVQARPGRQGEVTAAVDGAGASVLGVVPEATYLVRATVGQRAELAASPSVRWSGLLQPSWKLPVAAPNRSALLALTGTQTYRVYGFRGTPEAGALAGALSGIAGVSVVTDAAPVIDVEATAAQLPAIAALPGVQWVGVRPTVVPLNAQARWVTDTGVRDERWATRDDRLTGAGQTAAVADTGVNYTYDLNDRAHAAFRDCEDAAAPRTDAVGTCKLADYTQVTPGNGTDDLLAVQPNATAHRKMAAYFDIGETGVSPRDDSAHGTHVAGSVNADYLANGTPDGEDGMAPGSRLVFQAIGTESGGLRLPADDYQLFRQAYRPSNPADVPEANDPADYAKYQPLEDARTHNNSYGLIAPVIDEGSANNLDSFVWDHEDMAIVVSAGNGGPGPASIGSPSVAKNNLSSCASANGRQPMASIDSVAIFSSHGPTGDGRLGPDVCTPGQIVTSAKGGSSGDDHYLQGTSMSGPILTGLITLVRQYFWDGFGPAGGKGTSTGVADAGRKWNPSAALVRATTINGADRMRGRYSGDDGSRPELDGQWPSNGQGFGLVNLRNSMYFPGAERSTWFQDVYRADDDAFGAGSGATREYQVDVAEGQPLDVTLAWTDAPTGLPAGTPALVNNLDLQVVGPDGTYVGNNFTTRASPKAESGETPPGQTPPDTKNTAERVRIAAPTAGTYTIRVRGTDVFQGQQGFALAASGLVSDVGQVAPVGQPLQVDVAGDPAISDIVVEQVSADTSRVRFTTSEPTTATATLTGGAEPLEFADVYTPSNGSRFQTEYATGPIETSPTYADKPVLSPQHEILLYGLDPGVTYSVALTATDLAERTASAQTSLTSPGMAFQPLARDIGQLSEGATDNIPSTVATGTGWRTGTQLYAGYSGGTGLLGAFMFRMPESVDPEAVQGAVVELTGGHVLASLYDADPRITLDLLPEEEEARWGTQNYRDLRTAPAVSRVRPESALLRGGGEKRYFSFGCAELAALKASLAATDGERRAAFRLDSSLVPDTSLPSYEFGFNRRSRGPELRPRLVLLTAPAGGETSRTPCSADTPAPVIDDVGVAPGTTPDAVTVSWRTQVPSDSTVLFREKGATQWTQVANPARALTHEVQVLGLDSTKEYEFGVRSTTCNGLTTTADNGGAGWDFFRPPPPPRTGTSLFFTGLESDQVTKSTTATFTPQEPTGEPPIVQTTSSFNDPTAPYDPAAAYWTGDYAGAIDAEVDVPLYAASTNATAILIGSEVDITVFADPDDANPGQRIIGQQRVRLDVGPVGEPALTVPRIQVTGPVTSRLQIQVAPYFVDTGQDIQINYGAASTPSGFTVLDPAPAPAPGAETLPRVGPVPPPSAGGSGLDLAAEPTRGLPTEADTAAGTMRCAVFAPPPVVDPTPDPEPEPDPGQLIAVACPAGRVPPSGFTDIAGNFHKSAIECMKWWEIALGVTDTRYDPFVDLTRDRMASFVARLIDEAGATLPAGPDAFTDDNGNHHEANINRLAAAKIIDGKGGGRYGPGEVIRRDQMAKFLVNAFEYVSATTLTASRDYFTDDNGNLQEVFINKAAEAGFTTGRTPQRYDPVSSVKRDAMASFLARTLNVLVREGTTPPKQ